MRIIADPDLRGRLVAVKYPRAVVYFGFIADYAVFMPGTEQVNEFFKYDLEFINHFPGLLKFQILILKLSKNP